MENAIISFNSGQNEIYQTTIAPLERRLKSNNVINISVCICVLLFVGVLGMVIGYSIVPTLAGPFVGLLGGSVVGLAILFIYFFVRSSILVKTKAKYSSGLSSCEESYMRAYSIPAEIVHCEVLASDFLPKTYYGPSIAYHREDNSISIIAENFTEERNELRYSFGTVKAYAVLADSSVLVQSEEGFAILSGQIKELFVSSNLPLLDVCSEIEIDVSKNSVSVTRRREKRLFNGKMNDYSSWDDAQKILESYHMQREGE